MTHFEGELRDHLVAAIDEELGDRLAVPSDPPAAKVAPPSGARRWVPAVAAAAVVAAVAGVAVFVANRDDSPTPPAGDGTGVRVTCSARSGDAAPDRDRLLERALALSDDAAVDIDGATAVITVPGASADDVAELCAPASLGVRPLVIPTVNATGPGNDPAPDQLPVTEEDFYRLPAEQRAALIAALSETSCPSGRPRADLPLITCSGGTIVDEANAAARYTQDALLGPAIVTQDEITGAQALPPDAQAATPAWAVELTLDDSGSQALGAYTAAHNTGGETGGGSGACGPAVTPCADYLVIVVNGRIASLAAVTLSPIGSGTLQISGAFTASSSRRLAAQLSAALPVPLEVTSVDPY